MHRTRLSCVGVLCTAVAVFALAAQRASAAEHVTIVIGIPNGAPAVEAQYWPDGLQRQRPKLITVGDFVKWDNQAGGPGNTPHTATSDILVGGNPLFTTGQIQANQQSAEIEFTPEKYNAAKTALGLPADEQEVHIGYHCANHPEQMSAHLVLVPQGFKAKKHSSSDR